MAPPLDSARSATDPSPPGSRKHNRSGVRGPCSGLHSQCHRLLLHLRHGVRTDPEHPLLRDLPDSSARHLHRHLRHDVLDRRHHCHLLAPGHAQLFRPSRRILHLRRRLLRRVGLRVPQGARNQRDAARSYYGVLRSGSEAECGEWEELKVVVGVWFLVFRLFLQAYFFDRRWRFGAETEGEKLVVVLRKMIDYQV